MRDENQAKGARWLQFLCVAWLSIASIVFLATAPRVWNYSPDAGVYVGTAESMATDGSFRFNGQPNLLVYPGFPSLLFLVILLRGTDFHALHLLCSAIVVASLWLASAYFSPRRYGWAGAAVPVVLASSTILHIEAFRTLSGATFLAISLGALLLWRRHAVRGDGSTLLWCCVLVAIAPLVRFEGLLLCAALFICLASRAARFRTTPRVVARSLVLGIATFLPFAAWTTRNLVLYTPHTRNMALEFFFALDGLTLYGVGFGRHDWIEPEWMYGVYRLAASLDQLSMATFGPSFAQWIGGHGSVVLLLLLVAIGAPVWFARATSLERGYVVLSLGFQLWLLLSGRTLYTVARYWLPLLPFIAFAVAAAFERLHAILSPGRLRHLPTALAGLLLALVVYQGAGELNNRANRAEQQEWQRRNTRVEALAAFVRQQTPSDAAIATTDTGVMPRALGRPSFAVIPDADHCATLERMVQYDTRYLVITDTGQIPREARKLVVDLPHLFHRKRYQRLQGSDGAVYAVDLAGIRAFLALDDSAECSSSAEFGPNRGKKEERVLDSERR